MGTGSFSIDNLVNRVDEGCKKILIPFGSTKGAGTYCRRWRYEFAYLNRCCRQGISRGHALVIALSLTTLLTSCGTVNKAKSLFGGKIPIEISVADDVNQSSPLAVDVVVVSNKKILEKLLEMPASSWFKGREQFAMDYPKGYRVMSWEWVPGQEVGMLQIPYKSGVKAVVVYADFFSPGQHRAWINHRKPTRLRLQATSFTLEEL
jgi:type VI secretion system protein